MCWLQFVEKDDALSIFLNASKKVARRIIYLLKDLLHSRIYKITYRLRNGHPLSKTWYPIPINV